MPVLVRRRASLVYRVTEDLKRRMLERLRERQETMAAALATLDSALDGAPESAAAGLSRRRDSLVKARDECAARIALVEGLQEGAEVTEGSVEILTSVSVGDSEDRLQEARIVICDGRVVEIDGE